MLLSLGRGQTDLGEGPGVLAEVQGVGSGAQAEAIACVEALREQRAFRKLEDVSAAGAWRADGRGQVTQGLAGWSGTFPKGSADYIQTCTSSSVSSGDRSLPC